jgi:hypothetical protein
MEGINTMERWKWVVGYEGLYEVSDLGRVRSVDRVVRHSQHSTKNLLGRVLRPAPYIKSGRLGVLLCKEGVPRTTKVHRIVMAAWVGPCPDGCEVRHGPNGVSDNSVSNLSYGTRSENQLDRRRDGTDNGRRVVRSDGVEFVNMREAAEESDCHASHIWLVCKGKAKSARGYGWRYCDD